jgi:hypothetical protein
MGTVSDDIERRESRQENDAAARSARRITAKYSNAIDLMRAELVTIAK